MPARPTYLVQTGLLHSIITNTSLKWLFLRSSLAQYTHIFSMNRIITNYHHKFWIKLTVATIFFHLLDPHTLYVHNHSKIHTQIIISHHYKSFFERFRSSLAYAAHIVCMYHIITDWYCKWLSWSLLFSFAGWTQVPFVEQTNCTS